ncbi:PilZ domain-containing protein [Desulfuromonas sp. DDH964]|uniref:PilZ domain-containing protein n=1 Tax=Desulfuromonas sp. DDH964 TaxID=1823759 RepID=UPI00082F4F2D|nr:PilZ domain-containing protein [Desulfuromonas sp. DDH964]
MLRALAPETSVERFEALTVFLKGQGPNYLDLTLPYQLQEGEGYPFTPGMAFEILSDAMGLGIRLTGNFQSARDVNQIRLSHNNDLQLIRRRTFRRRDTLIGLRYTKGRGALRTFREQWEKNTRILNSGGNLARLPDFPRCKVNLSAGGIRFAIKLPVAVADLCLLLLELPDGKPPVCALSEIAWLAEGGEENRCQAGMQFIQILESDRKRIEQFIAAGGGEET